MWKAVKCLMRAPIGHKRQRTTRSIWARAQIDAPVFNSPSTESPQIDRAGIIAGEYAVVFPVDSHWACIPRTYTCGGQQIVWVAHYKNVFIFEQAEDTKHTEQNPNAQ